jgi:hypothetical protein
VQVVASVPVQLAGERLPRPTCRRRLQLNRCLDLPPCFPCVAD